MIPPELFGMGLPELLSVYYAGKVSKDSLDWISDKIKEILAQKRYGFTPEPQIAAELQQITKSDAYRRTKECIGNTPLLNVIRLGLRMEKLTEEGKIEAIGKIKNDVIKKYGPEGITILNMGGTGVLIPIILHLSDMKIENDYDQNYMLDYFNNVIASWSDITIFHQTEHGQEALTTKIKQYMNSHFEIFFVFSIGTAGGQAIKSIATIRNDGTIKYKGYTFTLISKTTDQNGRDHFAWLFRNRYNFEKTYL
ncbi:MAG TPA: hypothetical protein C5S51_09495 [Methanosarcinaceae archaeon]|nr:hypothetical protein [Methanosarcinaceae archaeon]